MATVVLVGTLDTKGREHAFLRDRVLAAGCDVILVDAGVRSSPSPGDVTADEVAAAAGVDRGVLAAGDRGTAVAAMGRGAREVVRRLHAEGRLDGIAGMGGSGGSSIIAAAMQALPLGVPKLLVSTMASGDTRAYVGTSDIAIMNPVVDIAGINRVSERLLANVAGAIAGMTLAAAAFLPSATSRPLVAATMYGTTTPCVDVARQVLEQRGYEVLVFHANGAGGRAMESLVRAGLICGVLDATTAELSNEVLGGTLTAGPDRLEAAGAAGIPQVVSLGGLDQVAFGPPETVPEAWHGRRTYRHNPSITLVRPNAEESADVGRAIAARLNAAAGPVSVFVPLAGISTIDVPGGPMHDPAADAALAASLRAALRPEIELVEVDTDINDPAFARAMAERLADLIAAGQAARHAQQEEVRVA